MNVGNLKVGRMKTFEVGISSKLISMFKQQTVLQQNTI